MTVTPSLKTILERIAAIERTVTGITAFDAIPRQIERAAFPLMINYPKASVRAHIANDIVAETRTFELYLLYAPALQGTEFQQYEAYLTSSLIDSIAEAFHARRTLALNDNGIVERAVLEGDGGIVPIAYPTAESPIYMGTIFRLLVDRSIYIPSQW